MMPALRDDAREASAGARRVAELVVDALEHPARAANTARDAQ